MVFEFFSKKCWFQTKKFLQLNKNYKKNFVFGLVFDFHQVKLGSALQKTYPRDLTISSFLGRLAVFLADFSLFLKRLSRKRFRSDRTNSGKSSFQTIQTIQQSYSDSRPRSDHTIQTLAVFLSDCPARKWCPDLTMQTLDGFMIRLSRP